MSMPPTATLLSLYPFPLTILDRILGSFAQTTELVRLESILPDLVACARFETRRVLMFDSDVTLARLHESLALPMAQRLVELIDAHQKDVVILTGAWFDDIERDLTGGYKRDGVNFLSLLPEGASGGAWLPPVSVIIIGWSGGLAALMPPFLTAG